jgi:hypothetical protein
MKYCMIFWRFWAEKAWLQLGGMSWKEKRSRSWVFVLAAAVGGDGQIGNSPIWWENGGAALS